MESFSIAANGLITVYPVHILGGSVQTIEQRNKPSVIPFIVLTPPPPPSAAIGPPVPPNNLYGLNSYRITYSSMLKGH
uniref:Uncharacterized protein n=1 Tax=Xenopus tropicalis TaxID=8364 RepID=A0A1B8XXC6_XENTR